MNGKQAKILRKAAGMMAHADPGYIANHVATKLVPNPGYVEGVSPLEHKYIESKRYVITHRPGSPFAVYRKLKRTYKQLRSNKKLLANMVRGMQNANR